MSTPFGYKKEGGAGYGHLPSLHPEQPRFIPMSQKECAALGWDELDVLLISGDGYVDHPSFGIVLLARWLIAHNFRVGLIAQPAWDRVDDILVMGRPRLFCGIGAGCVDSLLSNYTSFRAKRKNDAYTPGGVRGRRPNRASIVYANLARRAFPGLPLVLGGIEASTRRVTHYDFWSDNLRRPILFDAKADLLVWGMGERAILEIASRLARGEKELRGIPGTAWICRTQQGLLTDIPSQYHELEKITLPSHEEILSERRALLTLTHELERQVHQMRAWAYERVGDRALVLAPTAAPLTTPEMDELYSLPFTRTTHPSCEPIPAEEMLRTSMTSHRGCGGGCSFCSLAMHQGRRVSSRSEESLLNEAEQLAQRYPGSRREQGLAISDVGGPTANMWKAVCRLEEKRPGLVCKRRSCCFPTLCPFFACSQEGYVKTLEKIAALPGVRRVRISSGIRPDLALTEPEALARLIRKFTGGQLKLAPEHSEEKVLRFMRKPPLSVFERFLAIFTQESKKMGLKQYIVPYLISAFPGSTDHDMQRLSAWLSARNWSPRQTQCFIPTPGTVATAMYYAGLDEEGHELFVARTDAERLRQHRILMGETGPGGKSDRKETDGHEDARRSRRTSGRGRVFSGDTAERPQRGLDSAAAGSGRTEKKRGKTGRADHPASRGARRKN